MPVKKSRSASPKKSRSASPKSKGGSASPTKSKGGSASPKKSKGGSGGGTKKVKKGRKGKKAPTKPSGPPKEPLTHTEIVDAYYVCHNAAQFLTYTGFVKAETKTTKKGRKGKAKKKK